MTIDNSSTRRCMSTSATTYENLFDARKALTKKVQQRQVKRGVWVQVKWLDQPDTVELVLHTPDWRERGEVDVETFSMSDPNSWVTHNQIVAVLGKVQVPRLPTYCR